MLRALATGNRLHLLQQSGLIRTQDAGLDHVLVVLTARLDIAAQQRVHVEPDELATGELVGKDLLNAGQPRAQRVGDEPD